MPPKMPTQQNPFRRTCILIFTKEERMLREYVGNLLLASDSAVKLAARMKEMVTWYSNKVHVV